MDLARNIRLHTEPMMRPLQYLMTPRRPGAIMNKYAAFVRIRSVNAQVSQFIRESCFFDSDLIASSELVLVFYQPALKASAKIHAQTLHVGAALRVCDRSSHASTLLLSPPGSSCSLTSSPPTLPNLPTSWVDQRDSVRNPSLRLLFSKMGSSYNGLIVNRYRNRI